MFSGCQEVEEAAFCPHHSSVSCPTESPQDQAQVFAASDCDNRGVGVFRQDRFKAHPTETWGRASCSVGELAPTQCMKGGHEVDELATSW